MSRTLALKIACSAQADREWILGQLPHQERQLLADLILEIQEMGLDKDPSIINSLATPLVRLESDDPVPPMDKERWAQLGQAHPFWQALAVAAMEKSEREKSASFLSSEANELRFTQVPPALHRTVLALLGVAK